MKRYYIATEENVHFQELIVEKMMVSGWEPFGLELCSTFFHQYCKTLESYVSYFINASIFTIGIRIQVKIISILTRSQMHFSPGLHGNL